jgi:hypothetical protein
MKKQWALNNVFYWLITLLSVFWALTAGLDTEQGGSAGPQRAEHMQHHKLLFHPHFRWDRHAADEVVHSSSLSDDGASPQGTGLLLALSEFHQRPILQAGELVNQLVLPNALPTPLHARVSLAWIQARALAQVVQV